LKKALFWSKSNPAAAAWRTGLDVLRQLRGFL
jgi:hypothetical protein